MSEVTQQQLERCLKQAGLTSVFRAAGVLPSACAEYMSKFLTSDPDMQELKRKVSILADTNHAVLIHGETGTGKELIAQALHGVRQGKFVAINMTSLPDYLIESELFGHAKGSFTGAHSDKVGLLEYAEQGTVFLDEIGDLPASAQAKLLRVLQEKTIRRVGSLVETPISCRVVCATHQDLQKMITTKQFREDLYWRLSTVILETKPLRFRPQDIELLLTEKLDTNNELPAEYRKQLSTLALKGNVRELEILVARYKLFNRV